MFGHIKKRMSIGQKARIKYLIQILSKSHLESLGTHSRYGFNLESLFCALTPSKTNLELVRVGGTLDGSYLIPKLEREFGGVISPGVGQTFDFEKNVVGTSTLVVLIDGTVSKPESLPSNFIFISKLLGAQDSEEGDFVSLKTVVNEYFGSAEDLVLQMDIEGGEYEVLNSLSGDELNQFALVVVEFHHLHNLEFNAEWNKSLEHSILCLQKDFELVHTHPNNAGGFFVRNFAKYPKVVETTWVRKDLVDRKFGPSTLPNPLDIPNDSMLEDIQFPRVR